MDRQEETVIDASVAVKWFSGEKSTETALGLRTDHIDGRRTLVAPDLLVYEVGNALRFNSSFDKIAIANALQDLMDLQIDLIVPSREFLKKSSEFADEYKVTLYDACYRTRRINGY